MSSKPKYTKAQIEIVSYYACRENLEGCIKLEDLNIMLGGLYDRNYCIKQEIADYVYTEYRNDLFCYVPDGGETGTLLKTLHTDEGSNPEKNSRWSIHIFKRPRIDTKDVKSRPRLAFFAVFNVDFPESELGLTRCFYVYCRRPNKTFKKEQEFALHLLENAKDEFAERLPDRVRIDLHTEHLNYVHRIWKNSFMSYAGRYASFMTRNLQLCSVLFI
jgi:hypothetical protein